MSDHASANYCRDCMFEEFGIEEGPCKGCADSLPHPRFKHALKEGDLIELAGAWHRVAHANGMYWLHRDLPAHNLQIFFDAGMSADDAADFFRSVDNGIVPDGSWPSMSMLQLVRCIYAIQNDARFSPDKVQPAPVEEDQHCYDCKFSDLDCTAHPCKECIEIRDTGKPKPHFLEVVPFGYGGACRNCEYEHDGMHTAPCKGCLGTHGHKNPKPNFMPKHIVKTVAEPVTVEDTRMSRESKTFKNAEELAGDVLQENDIVVFTVRGESVPYEVRSNYMTCIDACNDLVFDLLDMSRIEKTQFAEEAYGYRLPKSDGFWPYAERGDYAALTRAVVCLMHLAEAREIDKVKSLRAKLAELVAQRESYEEDVQAAKKSLDEAEEAVSQARLALSYEECAFDTLQEDIDKLEEELVEALVEALEGK